MSSGKGSSGNTKSGALFDLRVIDLGHYIAGPYCAALLAGLGAEVIKVEPPNTGDGARSMGPFPEDEPHLEKSGLFNYLNQGKKGITLNLKSEAGEKIFRKLVAEADVLVENFEPRVMPSLGLGYESLKEINPSLVMTSISNFGQNGPYRDYRGYEITLSALGGVQAEIGEPDREPVKLDGPQLQFEAGLTAAFATLSAIWYRNATGTGQHIDLAIIEVAAILKGAPIVTYQQSGHFRVRNGTRPMGYGQRPPDDAPQPERTIPGAYIAILPCKDGYVCIDSEIANQWLGLCDMIGRPDLKEDPRFMWTADGAYLDDMDAIMIDYLKDKTQREVFEEATAWRVPSAIVNDMARLFHDPQHRARGFFQQLEHPVLGQMEYPGHPFIMSETPWRQASGAPLLGEHNREILVGQLGYTEEELAAMTRGGVI